MPIEGLSHGRVNMAVKSCLASVSGFLSSNVWNDTQIEKEIVEKLLGELSRALGAKIILPNEPGRGTLWTVITLSRVIYELRHSFPPLAEQ